MPRRHLDQPCDFVSGENEGDGPASPLLAEDTIGRDLVTLTLGVRVSCETNHRFQTPVPLERGLSLASPINCGLRHDAGLMPLAGKPSEATEQGLDRLEAESRSTP